jgi:hypothetical protein
MNELWNYFKQLLRKSESSSPSDPLIHELIARDEAETRDYQRWKSTLVRRRLQGWLADQYVVFRVDPEAVDEALDFLDTPSSKGFAVHLHMTRYSRRDCTHFFDFLKERVLRLDYRTQISDTRSYQREDWVETVERHYLKPRPGYFQGHDFQDGDKMNQRYGNITIELRLRDEVPHYLIFRATSYRDRLFTEAKDFHLLMQRILDQEEASPE